jgi:alanine-glyoxylate transaminase/serine-glyoxylate transaminase/serine-pyruvate transaminase
MEDHAMSRPHPPDRLLLGPGPSMVHPRVYAAMARPLVGHLDPYFLGLLDTVQADLRSLFDTQNKLTLPISGTGSAGMEACFANLVEDGDEVVVGVNGVFGTRMREGAGRLGARVVSVEAPWGEIIDPQAVEGALQSCTKPRLVAVIHAETSTGAWQPLEDIAAMAHRHGALMVADCVTSLAGCPVAVDGWGIDACYGGTQKCLSCPPGLSPVTFSERALRRIASRSTKPRSWYLDLSLIGAYFGQTRVYHHTAPISMIYALSEALALIEEEGLDSRFERHRRNHAALMAGLATIGLEGAAAEGHRLWMLNSVHVPEGVDEAEVRRRLLVRHGIEIGPGLGPLAGKVWRIGLMGESSRLENVRRLLLALAAEIAATGRATPSPVEIVDAADRAASA